MSEQFRQDLIQYLQNNDRNGCFTDEDCEFEGMFRTTPENALEIVVDWMKDEIASDVTRGIVPGTVKDFSELHDYVDANCYGMADTLWPRLPTDGDQAYQNAFCSFWNNAQGAVDAWIKEHGTVGKAASKLYQ